MPAVSSDLKDLMSYQLNKFERTAVPSPDVVADIGISDCDRILNADYENLKCPDPPIDHNYENELVTLRTSSSSSTENNARCLCSKPSCDSDSHLNSLQHRSISSSRDHYCPEYEKAVKKSRMIVFGSGGDVIVDKNHGYANTNWLPSTSTSMSSLVTDPALAETEAQNCNGEVVVLRRRNSHNSRDSKNNFTINVNIPGTFDLDYFLKTHRLSINISISENKNSNGNGDDVPNDLNALKLNRKLLDQSGWYYRNVDWQESIRMLRNSPLGTFFLRDSGDPRYLFSLSVQSTHGPISSRITYSNGKFRLDSQERIVNRMPSFSTIIELIDYYTKYGLVKNPAGKQVWVDSSGQTFSPVQLSKPRRNEPGTLKHLSRLILNKYPELTKISIPAPIMSYLNEYPYVF